MTATARGSSDEGETPELKASQSESAICRRRPSAIWDRQAFCVQRKRMFRFMFRLSDSTQEFLTMIPEFCLNQISGLLENGYIPSGLSAPV